MIQYYINSKPVPRAIARHHLQQARPMIRESYLSKQLFDASKNDPMAVKFCADFGVYVAKI
jgi:hypothetical protein